MTPNPGPGTVQQTAGCARSPLGRDLAQRLRRPARARDPHVRAINAIRDAAAGQGKQNGSVQVEQPGRANPKHKTKENRLENRIG